MGKLEQTWLCESCLVAQGVGEFVSLSTTAELIPWLLDAMTIMFESCLTLDTAGLCTFRITLVPTYF